MVRTHSLCLGVIGHADKLWLLLLANSSSPLARFFPGVAKRSASTPRHHVYHVDGSKSLVDAPKQHVYNVDGAKRVAKRCNTVANAAASAANVLRTTRLIFVLDQLTADMPPPLAGPIPMMYVALLRAAAGLPGPIHAGHGADLRLERVAKHVHVQISISRDLRQRLARCSLTVSVLNVSARFAITFASFLRVPCAILQSGPCCSACSSSSSGVFSHPLSPPM